MKQTVDFNEFCRAFHVYDRFDQFGYAALRALFDYLEGLEQDIGEEMALDVIALCCDWTAYASAVDACKELAAAGEPVEPTRTAYIAGWNMPGYMPDSEPVQFDDADEAWEYIADSMEEHADSLEDSTADNADNVAALRICAEVLRVGDGEFGITIAGWHYWVTAEPVPNEEAEQQCLEWLQDQTTVIEYDGGILVMAF